MTLSGPPSPEASRPGLLQLTACQVSPGAACLWRLLCCGQAEPLQRVLPLPKRVSQLASQPASAQARPGQAKGAVPVHKGAPPPARPLRKGSREGSCGRYCAAGPPLALGEKGGLLSPQEVACVGPVTLPGRVQVEPVAGSGLLPAPEPPSRAGAGWNEASGASPDEDWRLSSGLMKLPLSPREADLPAAPHRARLCPAPPPGLRLLCFEDAALSTAATAPLCLAAPPATGPHCRRGSGRKQRPPHPTQPMRCLT